MNDFGSVLVGNYEESAEYRNLALGSGAVKVAKDAASVGWSALKWTGRSTGEVIGAFLGRGSDRAIANGRAAGDFIPDVVVLIGTGGLSSAGRATVQGGVAIANGIEKAAVFTKNAVQATGTMNRGAELAYAGTNVGSGTSKAMTAARGAEMGNLAREGISGAREATAAATEKSLAKDMSPRVKNVESASDPRIGFKGRDYLNGMSDRSGISVQPLQRGALVDALQTKEFTKLNPIEKSLHRKQYEAKYPELINSWEKNTGQKWPTYKEDYIVDGKLLGRKGRPLQAHHIIPQQIGGPNEWWNLHPLEFKDHQQWIHTRGSPLSDLMKGSK